MSIEMVNLFDESGELTGSVSRDEAHAKGLLHDVVHCWFVDPRDGGRVFFQQRAADKATFPLYYDIAVGGHITAGEGSLAAVRREVAEEVGLELQSDELLFCGSLRKADYFSEGLDREIGRVFLCTREDPRFAPGPEVERMVWIPLKDYLRRFELPALRAYTLSGEPVEIAPERWAGTMSREFEDLVLPHIQDRRDFFGSCSAFQEDAPPPFRYEVTGLCPDFYEMNQRLDRELDALSGGPEARAPHIPYNTVEAVTAVVMAYDGKKPVGCTGIRPGPGGACELKRMYVRPEYRAMGIGRRLLERAESEARRQGFCRMVLETCPQLEAACVLYSAAGYVRIPNYPPYDVMEDSLCFGKDLEAAQ